MGVLLKLWVQFPDQMPWGSYLAHAKRQTHFIIPRQVDNPKGVLEEISEWQPKHHIGVCARISERGMYIENSAKYPDNTSAKKRRTGFETAMRLFQRGFHALWEASAAGTAWDQMVERIDPDDSMLFQGLEIPRVFWCFGHWDWKKATIRLLDYGMVI